MFVIIPESLDRAIDKIIREVEPDADPRAAQFDDVRGQLVGVFSERGTLEGVSLKKNH